MNLFRFFIVANFCLLSTLPAFAGPIPLSKTEQNEVLNAIEHVLEHELYDDRVAQNYISALDRFKNARGVKNSIDSDAFAIAIHRVLQRTKSDYHLSIFSPSGTTNPESIEDSDTHDGGSENMISVVTEENGIKLLKFENFSAEERDLARMYEAFREVENARGIIFDLRGNGGGDAKLARLMLGCLLKVPTPLYSIEIPNGKHPRFSNYISEPTNKCAHVSDKPMAVLVDHATASTAELFPMILQKLGRAVIIGEQTTGAAHAAEYFPLAQGFVMIAPIGYVRDATTGKDWEGDGVTPDIVVKPIDARLRAVDAIEQIIECESKMKLAGSVFNGYSCIAN
jgi:hypothetical protein